MFDNAKCVEEEKYREQTKALDGQSRVEQGSNAVKKETTTKALVIFF